MHTCETFCSHITTNPGSAEAQDWYKFVHHHFILYVTSGHVC